MHVCVYSCTMYVCCMYAYTIGDMYIQVYVACTHRNTYKPITSGMTFIVLF